MRKPKLNRLLLVIVLILSTSTGVWIILSNLSSNIMFFYTPTEVFFNPILPHQKIKVGGKVKPSSFKIMDSVNAVEFILTDCNHDILVHYKGALPPMFRDGQGVVAQGFIDTDKKLLQAERLFTKHDETYKPPSLQSKLKQKELCMPQLQVLK